MQIRTIDEVKNLSQDQIKELNPDQLGKAYSLAFGHGSLTNLARRMNKAYITIYRTFKGKTINTSIIAQAQNELINFSKN